MPHLVLVDAERFDALQPIVGKLKDLGVGPVRALSYPDTPSILT
jgi:hypothetical protein